jgi:cell division protein FtsZ
MNIQWIEEHEGVVIKVVGVGGAGCNSVSRMVGRVRGVEVVAVDADHPSLLLSHADTKLHIGGEVTRGCGAGGDPERGRECAEKDRERIRQAVLGADLVVVTAGLGRGVGTGAAPVVAHLAREVGALTLGLVTTPFEFVGGHQTALARAGLEHLRSSVDALVSLPSDALLTAAPEAATVQDTFLLADSLLLEACEALSEVIQEPGLINLGISDLRAVLQGSGDALVGVGTATGESSWEEAPRCAVRTPMFGNGSLKGARSVLAGFSVHPSAEVRKVIEAAKVVREEMGEQGDLVMGLLTRADMDPTSLRVLLVAGGVGSNGNGRRRSVACEEFPTFAVPPDTGTEQETDGFREIEQRIFDEPAIERRRARQTVAVSPGHTGPTREEEDEYRFGKGYRLKEAE